MIPGVDPASSWWPVALVGWLAVVTVGPAAWALSERPFDPLLFVMGVVGYFVLVPAAFLALTGAFAYQHAEPWRRLVAALLVSIAAVAALLGGYSGARAWLRRLPTPGIEGRAVDSRQLLRLGLVGMGLGVLSFAFFVAVNGGVERLLTVRPRTAFQTVPETGRFRLLGLAGVFGGWLTVWIALRPVVEDPRRRLRSRPGLVLAGTFAAALAFAVLSRERLKILYIAVFGLSYLGTTGRVDTRQLVVYGGLLGLLGVVFTSLEQALVGSARVADLLYSLVNPLRLEAFMAVVDGVPDRRPYQWGATYAKTFVAERGRGTLAYGDQVELLLRGRNVEAVGFSGMVWGELWLNFGLAGVLLGSGLHGAAVGAVAWFQRHAATPTASGVAAVLVATVAVAVPAASTWITKVLVVETLLPVLLAVVAACLLDGHGLRPPMISSRR